MALTVLDNDICVTGVTLVEEGLSLPTKAGLSGDRRRGAQTGRFSLRFLTGSIRATPSSKVMTSYFSLKPIAASSR